MSRPFWRSNQHNHFKKLLFLHSLTVLSTLAFDDSNKVDPLFTIGCQIPRNIICFYKKNILKTSCNQETQHRILRGGCLPFSLHTLYICSKSCDKHSITIAASPDCRTSITCRVRRIECNQHPWIFTRGRSYLAMLLVVTPPRHRGIQNFAWSIPSLRCQHGELADTTMEKVRHIICKNKRTPFSMQTSLCMDEQASRIRTKRVWSLKQPRRDPNKSTTNTCPYSQTLPIFLIAFIPPPQPQKTSPGVCLLSLLECEPCTVVLSQICRGHPGRDGS